MGVEHDRCIFGQIGPDVAKQCGGIMTEHHVLGRSEGGANGPNKRPICFAHHQKCHESDVHGNENFAYLFVLYKYGDPPIKQESASAIFGDIQRWINSMVDYYSKVEPDAPMIAFVDQNGIAKKLNRAELWKTIFVNRDWVSIAALINLEANAYESNGIYQDGSKIAKALRRMSAIMLEQIEINTMNGYVSDFSGEQKTIERSNHNGRHKIQVIF